MPSKYIAPSATVTAFNCPHCGVLTSQYWADAFSADVTTEARLPNIWRDLDEDLLSHLTAEERSELFPWLKRAATGDVFYDTASASTRRKVVNLNLSKCMECARISIWVHGGLVWPQTNEAPDPNPDLPEAVRADFMEAGLVLNTSPRSAAALLRQAVQRLCKALDEKGRNIDEDIASLVRKGLDPRVQKALDVVRVIGNNAVHPGQIDLRDDRATAEKLFGLVNLIADIMISQPKHIDSMFDGLPEGARKAIAKRDGTLNEDQSDD